MKLIIVLFLASLVAQAQDFTKFEGAISCGVLGFTRVSETRSTIDLKDDKFLTFSVDGISTSPNDIESFSKQLDWEFQFKQQNIKLQASALMESRGQVGDNQELIISRSGAVKTKIATETASWESTTAFTSFKGMPLYSEVLWDEVNSISHTVNLSENESLVITCAMLYKNPNYSE